MRHSNDELREVIDLIDPEYLLDREGIEYKATIGTHGRQLNVKECPTCGNKNWKVYLNAESGLGNCFVCENDGKNFNLFSFADAFLGGTKRETVAFLKEVAIEQGYAPVKKTAPVILHSAEITLPPSVSIPFEGANLKYLEERGVDADTARYFHLSFCEAGLYWYEFEGEQRYLDFSQRVLFPVFDLDGQLKTFQGRDITGQSKKKYLFPPGRAASGVLLYNIQNAIGADTIIIGEGVFDVIGIKMALDREPDLRGVVPIATFGKHLGCMGGDDQLARLLRLRQGGLKNVVMMWDGTRDAIVAAIKAARTLAGVGFNVRVARLPDNKDPNEVPPEVVLYSLYTARSYSNTLMIEAQLGTF